MQSFDQLRELFEEYLSEEVFEGAPTGLYEPINYILSIGGKRIRPVLLLAAYHLGQDDMSQALPAAFAIELFHNFTLLHDDIMDDAPLRRGEETVHEKYDINTAILSGDVMLIYAYEYLSKHTNAQLEKILKSFNTAAIQICEGQQMDVDFENREDVSIEDYLKMIEYKTAALLGAAMEIGGLLGGLSEQDAHHANLFARNLGIAFQIQDDILDTFGEKAAVGKIIGGDIIQSKKTYLYLKAKELLQENEIENFRALYNSDIQVEHQKVKKVKAVFNELYVIEYAKQLKEAYEHLAKTHLESISIPEERQQPIKELVHLLTQRSY